MDMNFQVKILSNVRPTKFTMIKKYNAAFPSQKAGSPCTVSFLQKCIQHNFAVENVKSNLLLKIYETHFSESGVIVSQLY